MCWTDWNPIRDKTLSPKDNKQQFISCSGLCSGQQKNPANQKFVALWSGNVLHVPHLTKRHSVFFMFLCCYQHWNQTTSNCSTSAPFCVRCILDLQFGQTRPDRNFCTLAYIQPQPPFRQRFPLCFPESVCHKSMAVDLGRGHYTERVTRGMGEPAVGKNKTAKYIQLTERGK